MIRVTVKERQYNSIHAANVAMAEAEVQAWISVVEGRRCFNVSGMLVALEIEFEGSDIDGVSVDARQIARYLWCCLPRHVGETAGGDMFRGMRILD